MKLFAKVTMRGWLCALLAAVAPGLFAQQKPVRLNLDQSAPTKVHHPEWSRNAVIYEVNTRQYTPEGTFKAFGEQLPRLKDLGVDILWFMPIHPISQEGRKGTLGSYYAVQDYTAVNPEFGTLDDFRDVVNKAHDLGMKVIIDWVPNHSGRDNKWVKEHPDWYARNDKGEMFGDADWTDVYKFDYNNPAMRRGMTDAMKFWLEEAGINGFRCDVAMMVPVDFWNQLRPELEAVQPSLFMLAEASQPDLNEQGFDMSYNWPMKDLFSHIANTQGEYTFKENPGYPFANALSIDTMLLKQAREWPADSYLMNMVTNHDLNSWEGTEFQRLGKLEPAFAVLTYTLPGMPLIYTGQETGMNRRFEFFEKDRAPEWEPRNGCFDFYQTLNALKHHHRALRAGLAGGGEMLRYATASPDLYVFERRVGDDRVLTAVNLGKEELPLTFTGAVPDTAGLFNIFTGESKLPATLIPGGYAVLATR